MFCPNCGAQIAEDSNFCSYCGKQLNLNASIPAINAGTETADGDMVMLLGLGKCTQATAVSVISETCGYSADEALMIAQNTPITIVRGLTDTQARMVAQALSEYGLEIAVYDRSGWRELEPANTSVWDKAGSLIASAVAALGFIGLKNRITRDLMHRWDYPFRFNGARPPMYRLHNTLIRQTPPPRRVPEAPRSKRLIAKRSASAWKRAHTGSIHSKPENDMPHDGHGQPGGHGQHGGNGQPGGHAQHGNGQPGGRGQHGDGQPGGRGQHGGNGPFGGAKPSGGHGHPGGERQKRP